MTLVRLILFGVTVAAAATVIPSNVDDGPQRATPQLVLENVGGMGNACTCSQRIEP